MLKTKITIIALAIGVAMVSPANAQFSGDLYKDCLSFAPDYATQYYRSRIIHKRTRASEKKQNKRNLANGMTQNFVDMSDLAVDAAYDAKSLENAYNIAVLRCEKIYNK